MFGLGFTEILVILAVALLVLGPDKLPDVARSLGKTFGQFQRSFDEIKREFSFPRIDPTDFPPVDRGPRGDVCETRKNVSAPVPLNKNDPFSES